MYGVCAIAINRLLVVMIKRVSCVSALMSRYGRSQLTSYHLLRNIVEKDCVCGHFFVSRNFRGSHLILRRDNPFAQVVVPNHKELDRGTLRAIIRQAGLSVNEFVQLL